MYQATTDLNVLSLEISIIVEVDVIIIAENNILIYGLASK